MATSVKPLNGYLPVKAFTGVQMSGEPTIPPLPTLGTEMREDQPLSRPCQKQKCLLPAWLYRIPQEEPRVQPMR